MVARRHIPENIQRQVRQRANGLCEYCHTIEKWQYVRFTLDHIIALFAGGTNELDNLALACFHCNRGKWHRLVGVDPETGVMTALYNPRQDKWEDHFIWSVNGTEIIGLTATGRATIALLRLNRERILNIRLADVDIGRHPPKDDPIL